jgi:hypothetical protein
MPLLRAFWDAARNVAPERAAAIDDGRQVGYETPEELGRLFSASGLARVSTGELSVAADFDSFDELMRPFAAGVGHSGACFEALDPARRAELAADAYRRLGSPPGRFTLTAHAWWARGEPSLALQRESERWS